MRHLSRVAVIVAVVGLVFFAVTMRFPAIQGSAALSVAQGLDPNHGCEYCHDLHGGAGYYALTLASTVEATCLSCHDGQNPLYPQAPVVTVHENKDGSAYAPFRMSCASCHTPHNDSDTNNEDLNKNIKLINATISTPNSGDRAVIFERRFAAAPAENGTMADGNTADLDGVCEVCHTQTDNHQNGTVQPDNSDHAHGPAKVRCSFCHSHSQKFEGVGGRCTSCHRNGTNGAPQVVAQFERTSHHIAWEGFASPDNVADSIPDADCTTCHSPLHDGQTDNIRFRNFDTGEYIQLNADPFTNAAARAQVTLFCLACHDDANPSPPQNLAPFSDGVTRPERDSTEFFLSGHQTNGQQCLDCHGTGHGSEKAKLLATAELPATVGTNQTTLYEEEEGLCFSCHDSDGPSSFDMESGFNTAPLWAQDATQSGPANQNDRHDVLHATQQTSGRRVECINCHNPHADSRTTATDNWPVRPDPDPTDGRVPGTDWFEPWADQNGAGPGMFTDFISEWCLDCHDGSGPTQPAVPANASELPPVDILNGEQQYFTRKGDLDTNYLNNWAENSHGAGASGASLKTGTNYWALDDVVSCRACHQPHPDAVAQPATPSLFNNLFLMNQVIRGTDFSTPIPSDAPDGIYELTSLTTGTPDVNSYYLCNTCHTSSMGTTRNNCFECHTHGDNRF